MEMPVRTPWMSLMPALSFQILKLLQAWDAAEVIAEQLEAARCIELALSALQDPTWPSSYVAAAAAKLLAGASVEARPPLVKITKSALKILNRMGTGPGDLLCPDILRYLKDRKPEYDEIPMEEVGPDAYDDICGHIEPIRRGIALALKEMGVAEWHYLCIRHYLDEAPYEVGMIAEAARHAKQAHACIEDAHIYVASIIGVLDDEPPEVCSFFWQCLTPMWF